ncbi:MAG: hypothetical protein H0U58_10125 [Chloroflexi bacterium]|nr:hypothetical protein [Chloroflexota bacterium]
MTDVIGEALVFLVIVAVIAAAGILLGMLAAPRLARLADRVDREEPGDDD